jgi:hypothetical protein
VLGSGLPWLLLLLPPLGIIYYCVQCRYRASSRELRRLGSLTLSPLYSHLADTLSGLPVIRAARATHRCVQSASPNQIPGLLGEGESRPPEGEREQDKGTIARG